MPSIRRRTVLGTVGAVASLAGCTQFLGSGGSNGGDGGSTTNKSRPEVVADWSTRRAITIKGDGEDHTEYPVVIESVDIGDASVDSIRVVDEPAGEIVTYATDERDDGVAVAFKTDINADETVERYALYYGNDDADDKSDDWAEVRYHWYDGFEASNDADDNWTESDDNPPGEFEIDDAEASEGNHSLHVEGTGSGDSAVGNLDSVTDRQYTLIEFDIYHVSDATQIRPASGDDVTNNGGFTSYRIKFDQLDWFCNGESTSIDYEEWHTVRFEFDWNDDDVGWDLFLDDEEVDSCSEDNHQDVETISGIIFRQAASGDGEHYIDEVKFFAEADVTVELGDAE